MCLLPGRGGRAGWGGGEGGREGRGRGKREDFEEPAGAEFESVGSNDAIGLGKLKRHPAPATRDEKREQEQACEQQIKTRERCPSSSTLSLRRAVIHSARRITSEIVSAHFGDQTYGRRRWLFLASPSPTELEMKRRAAFVLAEKPRGTAFGLPFRRDDSR